MFFGKRRSPFDSEEDGTVSLNGLAPARVPVDDGIGGLKLGFRTERSRSAATKECKDGVSSRCVSGAAGGCALSAARACAAEFPPRPQRKPKRKGGGGPLGAIQGIIFPGNSNKNDSKEGDGENNDNDDDNGEERKAREARDECERRHREECLEFAGAACSQHADSFCAVAVSTSPGEPFFGRRGEGDRGRMRDIADEIFESPSTKTATTTRGGKR